MQRPVAVQKFLRIGLCVVGCWVTAKRRETHAAALRISFAARNRSDMKSFAEERFRTWGRVARLCGAFFVSGAWHGAFEHCEPCFEGWYTVYVTLMVAIGIAYEVFMLALHDVWNPLERLQFFDKLFITLHFTAAVTVSANFLVLNTGTHTLVETLSATKRLELSIGFKRRDSCWIRKSLTELVFLVTMMACAICRGFVGTEITGGFAPFTAFLLSLLSAVFALFFGTTAVLVLYLEKYFCDVLANYVAFQKDKVKELLCGPHALAEAEAVRVIERIRKSDAAAAKIVRLANNWLRYPTVLYFLCATSAVCVVLYGWFGARTSAGKLLFTALYAACACVPMVDVSFAASKVKAEAADLKALLESASAFDLPARLSRLIEISSVTIDVEQLSFTGWGFFTIDRALLTSFMALVLTYSLILVQTGRRFEAPHC